MRHLAIVFLLLLVPSLAGAQDTPAGARCRYEAPPFAASDANRLSDTALKQLLTGKTFVYVREHAVKAGTYVRLSRELRSDGSFASTCESSGSREGGWKPCTSYGGAKQRVAGARDVGVWRIENRALCYIQAAFKNDVCFAIHRQGSALAAKNISGPRTNCSEGPVTVQ